MKKLKRIIAIGLATITFLSITTANVVLAKNQPNDLVNESANLSVSLVPYNKSNLFKTNKFVEVLDPEDFSFKSDGGIYLLDNLSENVVSYSPEGKIENIIDVSNLGAAKVTTILDDNVELLNAAGGKIYTHNNNTFEEPINNLRVETLVDLGVTRDNKPYVFLSDTGVGTTFIFYLQDNIAILSKKLPEDWLLMIKFILLN